MNLNLLNRFLKEHWRSGLIIAFSLFLYALLIGSLVHDFISNPAYKHLLDQYPKALLAFLAGAGGSIFTIEGFWSLEFLQLWWIVIVGGLVMAYAAGIVSTDMDEGTIEFLLTQPLTRSSLILSRLAGLSLYAAALVVTTMVSIGVLSQIFDVKIKATGLIAVGLAAFVFCMTIAAFTLLFSVLVKGRGRAIIYGVSVLLGSHLLNALAELNKTVKKFQRLSLFHYYRPQKLLTTGHVIWSDIAVFLVVLFVCLGLALLIFNRKDIAIP